MPRKIRQLLADLRKAGFPKVHQVGSHRKYEKNGVTVIVSGGEGDDAKAYQEKAVRDAIKKAK